MIDHFSGKALSFLTKQRLFHDFKFIGFFSGSVSNQVFQNSTKSEYSDFPLKWSPTKMIVFFFFKIGSP